MSRVRVTQLREERKKLFESMKGINDLQEKENRSLTGEENAEYEKHEQRLAEIDPDLKRLEDFLGLESRMGRGGPGGPKGLDVDPSDVDPADPEHRNDRSRRLRDREACL